MNTHADLYEHDFHAWTREQAALLRAGRFGEIDSENIAEEIESMGKSERRELVSRLAILLGHLLKWQYQEGLRSRSWSATIREQRRRIARHPAKNPSLESNLDNAFFEAYEDARYTAGLETGYSEFGFPAASPYTLEQALNDEFRPR